MRTFSGDVAPHSLCIESVLAKSITYASFQNAVPIVRSIEISNQSQDSFSSCRLELTCVPAFLRPKTWIIDRILPGDKIQISDRSIDLDPAYLQSLDEAETGEVSLRLVHNNGVLAEQRSQIRLLSRDEWGGVAEMDQLLPAFVMPNDSAVGLLIRSAADHLAASGYSSALDGYQSGDIQRTYMLAAAVYSAVSSLGLHYAEPPASFEKRGQKVRRPSTVLAEKLATCLDSTLLFCAAFEQIGLHPVILLFQGHATAGVWLVDRSFPNAISTDAMSVRKAIDLRELLVFETTAVTVRPALNLQSAKSNGERLLAEPQESQFIAAIDVFKSRANGVLPLASHTVKQEVDTESELNHIPSLPAEDDLPVRPPVEVEVKPTTATGRIARWQGKLLDLTLRNRLLNFRDTQKTIPFYCPDVPYLEDRLAEDVPIRLISLPEQTSMGERDTALLREQSGRDIYKEFALQSLQRDELSSTLPIKDLTNRLIDLDRQVRNDLAEGGANTLFLAIGFLRWKQTPKDEKSYNAPLLLVPVKLKRRSATSNFSLHYHEDDPRFNETLLQLLDRDFGLQLPQFREKLPLDGKGVDVPLLLDRMRRAVQDVAGLEVVSDVALSTFSFAKFLMWKDLVDRTDALRNNHVVRHLIDTPDLPFDTRGKVLRDERELDRRYDPAQIVALLPADSSQLAASVAAAEGLDFVLVGPPGTGKSQTIANMIAQCLSTGKTVLFVAEKTAALNVVHRRLCSHGLADQCLELHSNKTDRKRFFGQLRSSWESSSRSVHSDWSGVNEKLRIARDKLNNYVHALHKPRRNGLTPYLAFGIAIQRKSQHAPRLSWASVDAHSATDRSELEEAAAELGRVREAVGSAHPLRGVNIEHWTSKWEQELLESADALREAALALHGLTASFASALGLPDHEALSPSRSESVATFAEVLVRSAGEDHRIMLDADLHQLPAILDELAVAIRSYHEAEARLSTPFTRESVLRVPVDTFDAQWRSASAAFWPFSWLSQRRVGKLLDTYSSRGVANLANDLPLLRTMQECHAQIQHSALAGKHVKFAGLDTDVASIAHQVNGAIRLSESIATLSAKPDEVLAIMQSIAPVLGPGSTQQPLVQLAERMTQVGSRFRQSELRFTAASGVSLADSVGQASLVDVAQYLQELQTARSQLRDWTVWCRVRNRAVQLGLAPLVADLESGKVLPRAVKNAFELGYVRWWLPLALDADLALNEFRRFDHDHAIDNFRQLDDLVRKEATARVLGQFVHQLPAVDSVAKKSELGILRHQMQLQRPSRTIRELIEAMPSYFAKLAPCMLMSPLSIAQYLPPGQALFDVVIFDEASQITTWDAVGAIARGRQTIIVGDPKQLPPTNFFGRTEEDVDIEEHEQDLESILDEASTSGIPIRDLRWHYRSRSESLIAFSNHHYYENRLVTFPSPTVDDRAVQLRHVPDGVYDRGKSKTNVIEARALVKDAVQRMQSWLNLNESSRPTLGVITFNSQQQALIQDLFDEARQQHPDLEWFFNDDRVEPTMVKNLENVQGDERDVILFSITFWKDAAGKSTVNFGALNRSGGERRLNVAVTRARQELVLFSGFRADDINIARTSAVGVHHLKNFLDYAERGAIALPAIDRGSVGGYDSPFEEAVADALISRGWHIVPQVGVSGYRVDLGIRHPDYPGAYLAGVECDGATYHRSATARDRDKVREQVLRGLGWEIQRVWSTDWWHNSQGAVDSLHASLQALLADSRRKSAEAKPEAATLHWELGEEVDPVEFLADSGEKGESVDNVSDVPLELPGIASEPKVVAELVDDSDHDLLEQESVVEVEDQSAYKRSSVEHSGSVATSVPSTGGESFTSRPAPPEPSLRESGVYRLTDFSALSLDPEKYFDFSYHSTLQCMVQAILEAESPLREDVLFQRISRAHGWLRTGSRIKERIQIHLANVDRTEESSGVFLWRKGSVEDLLPYRAPGSEGARRSIAEIPLAELAAVVVTNPNMLLEADPAIPLARLLGVDRLTAPARARLAESIERARRYTS